MKENPVTKHHLVPRSYGGNWSPENLVRLKEQKHSAFHVVFDNKTYVGQILQLTQMTSSALSKRMVSDVYGLLADYEGEKELYAYKNGVLIPERFLEAQEKFNKR